MSDRRRFCRTCNRTAVGQPEGWYQVTVADNSQRGYRWLGTFCSIACLAGALPAWREVEKSIADKAVMP